MTGQCLDKDIKITPAKGRVHVIFDDAEIASSLNALELDEPGEPLRIYIPRGRAPRYPGGVRDPHPLSLQG